MAVIIRAATSYCLCVSACQTVVVELCIDLSVLLVLLLADDSLRNATLCHQDVIMTDSSKILSNYCIQDMARPQRVSILKPSLAAGALFVEWDNIP